MTVRGSRRLRLNLNNTNLIQIILCDRWSIRLPVVFTLPLFLFKGQNLLPMLEYIPRIDETKIFLMFPWNKDEMQEK